MKIPPSAGFLVLGLAIGFLFGKGPHFSGTATNDDSQAAEIKTRSNRPARTDSPGAATIRAIRGAAAADLAAITLRSAKTPDPIELQRLVAECLLSMTADNWHEVIDSFGQLTKETGRDLGEQWRLAHFRSGQVAGSEAMDTWLAAGLADKKNECWHTLHGWGTRDPAAAIAWLRNAEAAGNEVPNDFYGALIGGASMSNPAEALRLLSGLPGPRQADCAVNIVWDAMNHGGTEDLEPLLHFAADLDRSDPFRAHLANRLFAESTEALLKKADGARDVGQACEVTAKLIGFGQDPTFVTLAALRKYRWYDMASKLNIVESATSHATQPDLPQLVTMVMGTMNTDHGDAAVVRDWMVQHPGSPLVPLLEQRVPPN